MSEQNMDQSTQEMVNTDLEQSTQENRNNNLAGLPEEMRADLPQEAQNIFAAAFKAAQSDGISEEGARQIALNSVHEMFEKGKDGKWYAKGEVTAQHYKAVTSGGN